MKETVRYLKNVRGVLKKSPVEANRYVDDKYVKSACGIARLCVLLIKPLLKPHNLSLRLVRNLSSKKDSRQAGMTATRLFYVRS